MKQVEAVINVVTSFTADNSIAFELNGPKVEFTKPQIESMTLMLVASYNAGDITINSAKSAAAPAKYLRSMLKNHLRKDERLNGNVDYEKDVKKEGKKRITDPTLKELKKLFAAVSLGNDEKVTAEVKAALDAQEAKVAAEKSKTSEIDAAHIPAELQHILAGVQPTVEVEDESDDESETVELDDATDDDFDSIEA